MSIKSDAPCNVDLSLTYLFLKTITISIVFIFLGVISLLCAQHNAEKIHNREKMCFSEFGRIWRCVTWSRTDRIKQLTHDSEANFLSKSASFMPDLRPSLKTSAVSWASPWSQSSWCISETSWLLKLMCPRDAPKTWRKYTK